MAKKYGHPGSSGLAQSGGKNSTFGGGKGGTKESRTSTNDRRIGKLTVNGLSASVRTVTGSKAMTAFFKRVGKPPPMRGGGMTNTVQPTIRRPVRRGSS